MIVGNQHLRHKWPVSACVEVADEVQKRSMGGRCSVLSPDGAIFRVSMLLHLGLDMAVLQLRWHDRLVIGSRQAGRSRENVGRRSEKCCECQT